MNRLEKFLSLETHSWHKRNFKKLSKKHINICIDFINDNNELDKNDFEAKLNRMFLGSDFGSTSKPEKNRLLICMELISSSNM